MKMQLHQWESFGSEYEQKGHNLMIVDEDIEEMTAVIDFQEASFKYHRQHQWVGQC